MSAKKKADVLPRGLYLGSFDGTKTYLETCTCKSAWCNQPTVFYQGTDDICWPQTDQVRKYQTACEHVIDSELFEEQNRFSDESFYQRSQQNSGKNSA